MAIMPVGDAGFMGWGLDRADALRRDPAGLAAHHASPRSRLLRLAGLDPVIADDGLGGARLTWGSFAEAAPEAELVLLGLDDEGRAYFAALSGVAAQPGDWRIWGALEAMAPRDAAIYASARSLIDWHARHGFCARCGGMTAAIKGGWARQCDNCRAEHFPRVDPVVIMLVEHDGRVLLGRQPGWPDRRYSALAGFVEPGETIECAVRREVLEEAGVAVSDVRYVASQPWPFPSSLMVAAFARADDDALAIDTSELEDAFWCDAAGVTAALNDAADAPFAAPPPLAIARLLLIRWLAER